MALRTISPMPALARHSLVFSSGRRSLELQRMNSPPILPPSAA